MDKFYEEDDYLINITTDEYTSWGKTGNSNYISPGGKFVSIGNHVTIGKGVKIGRGVNIGDFSVIGDMVTVLPGVELGTCSKINSCQVVTKSPYHVKGTRHYVNECEYGVLRIGCEELTFNEWEELGEEIGQLQGYNAAEIEEYMSYIDNYKEVLIIRDEHGVSVIDAKEK